MTLTEHQMRRGHNQRPQATENISLTIETFHDAPVNAR
jgi:hypothetical protein